MKRKLAIVLLLLVSSTSSLAQDKPEVPSNPAPKLPDDGKVDQRTEDFWMEQKLELSKAILQSLTTSDFEGMRKSARQMQKLSKFEGFVRRRNAVYREQLQLFKNANSSLLQSAQDKHLENSLKAFHQLTSSCVRCHKLLLPDVAPKAD